jgi:DNA-binding transcriptional regulator YiaG
MTSDRNVSKLLTDWRAQARLSQSQAADVLGVSVRTLQGWEAGRSMPYPRLLEVTIKVYQRGLGSPSWPEARQSAPPR